DSPSPLTLMISCGITGMMMPNPMESMSKVTKTKLRVNLWFMLCFFHCLAGCAGCVNYIVVTTMTTAVKLHSDSHPDIIGPHQQPGPRFHRHAIFYETSRPCDSPTTGGQGHAGAIQRQPRQRQTAPGDT